MLSPHRGTAVRAATKRLRELGSALLNARQALSGSQRLGRGTVDVAILFTDLVGFSSWALNAGDEAALELLRQVGDVEHNAVSERDGMLVKRLGDGSMAVFSNPERAVQAAFETQQRLAEIRVEGHMPELRAGVHVGRPRQVRDDYIGVDVNIASRIADAAKPGEVLVSENARESLDPMRFTFGRKRRLRAPGAPGELVICPIRADE